MRADISAVNTALKGGGIVLLPTETVYGLAADARNQSAVNKLYRIKGREFNKPIAICVANIERAAKLVHWDDAAQKLASAFWPGPLSLVLPAQDDLGFDERLLGQFPDGRPSLSLRCPQAEWRGHIQTEYLALTSANKTGKPDHTEFQNAIGQFKDDVTAAIKGAPSLHAMPSTIVTITDGHCRILRQGTLKQTDFAPLNLSWDAP